MSSSHIDRNDARFGKPSCQSEAPCYALPRNSVVQLKHCSAFVRVVAQTSYPLPRCLAGLWQANDVRRPILAGDVLRRLPVIEKAMVDSGIILIKYWLEVGPDEQTRRIEGRIHDPRKVWKLSDMDLESYGRWYDYSRARDAMFAASDTPWAPWYVAHTDSKRRGRLNIISHLLSQVPYEPLEVKDVELPDRQAAGEYRPPACRRASSPHHSERVDLFTADRVPPGGQACPRRSARRPWLLGGSTPSRGGPSRWTKWPNGWRSIWPGA